MKITKRKTAIKCPLCKTVVIGNKYPPTVSGFSCDVKMNEEASKNSLKYYMNGQLNIRPVCKKCESDFKSRI